MTLEYLNHNGRIQVEHVDASEVHRWTTEHPDAVIVHAVPDPEPAD